MEYYPNGKLKGIMCEVNGLGCLELYYINGQVKSAFCLEVTKNDTLIQGQYLSYYSNGMIKSQENYTDGLLDGEQKYYFENGSIKGIENFKLGKEDGVLKEFNDAGKIKNLRFKKNGMTLYNKDYAYQAGITVLKYESFVPDILIQDTIKVPDSLVVIVNLSIPDSLYGSHNLFLCHSMGSFDFENTFPASFDKEFDCVKFDNKKPYTIRRLIQKPGKHLITILLEDKKMGVEKREIHNPIVKEFIAL
ncbi:MAG: hypothetical protein HY842_10615 [Bacteroidetes bacterium]|nr:hypothetical protein [Bacteroidota bacterium]